MPAFKCAQYTALESTIESAIEQTDHPTDITAQRSAHFHTNGKAIHTAFVPAECSADSEAQFSALEPTFDPTHRTAFCAAERAA